MRSILKKIGKLLDEKQKKKLFLLFVLTIIGTFLEVMSVSIMVPAMNILMDENIINTNGKIRAVCELLHISNYHSFVILAVVGMIAVYIIKDSFVVFLNYCQVRFVCNNRLAMQRKLLHIIVHRPYEYFLNIATGEITQMVIKDPNNAYSLLLTLLTMVADVIVSVALGITVFIISPLMTGIVVAILLVTMIIILRIARPKIKESGVIYRKQNSVMSSWVVQIVNGIKEIKVTNREKFFEKHYADITARGVKAEKTYKTISAIPRAMIEMVSVSAALVAILVMLQNGNSLEDLLPALSAFALAAIKLLPSANKIANAVNEIVYQQPFLDKLIENLDNLEYLDTQNESSSAGENGEVITLNSKVEFKDLSFAYPGTDRKILDASNMEIPVGKSVGIVGPSGAGKTTTVDILLGLLPRLEGEILADGKDIMDNYPGWLSHIGYIPQTIFILDSDVRENVAFGVPKDKIDEEKVWKALREAQLEEFVKALPEGLDTRVGERGVKISGGQRQRMGIARALYYDPDLLVFDEATSSLDNDTEAAIMESIYMLHGKKTMIIIAHRLQTIEGCDMVYRVEGGKITRER